MIYRLIHPSKSFIQKNRKSIAALALLLGITGATYYSIQPASASLTNTRNDPVGTVELSGADWLGGIGVDIMGNGNSAANELPGWNYVNSIISGKRWQCVELINRLFLTREWTTATWYGNGNQMYANAPSGLVKEASGSITSIAPGDVLSLNYTDGVGHAAVVSSVSGSTVTIANQNTTAVYSTATYNSTAKTLTMSGWANYTIIGVIHRPSGGNTTPPPPPSPTDTDGDGVIDSQDNCPTVYARTRNGCPKGDFDRNGKADISAFFRYDTPAASLNIWNGQANGNVSAPTSPWYQPGWEANEQTVENPKTARIIQAGHGDFNGDKKEDIATFYRHDGGVLDMNIWYGNGAGGFAQERPWYRTSGWEGARMIPAGIGDFNKDGKDDIAAFYRKDNNVTDLNIWWGNAVTSGPQVVTGPTLVWSQSGWDGSLMMPSGVTDITGDGKADIVAFYNHPNGMKDTNVWFGNGVGGFDLHQSWHIGSGWEGARLTPAGSGDFNYDGRGDVAAFYRYDGGGVNLWVWYGQADGMVSVNPNAVWHIDAPSGWDASRIMPAGVSDYNGDGKIDIATLYRYDNGALGVNMWYDNGGGYYFTNQAAWYIGSAWDGARLTPVKW